MTRQRVISEATPPTVPGTAGEGKAVAAVAVAVVLWASAFVAIRGVGEALSPAPMALVRLAVAAVALTVLVLLRLRRAPLTRLSWKALLPVALYAVLWLAGYTVALNAAERHVDAGTAAVLVNVAPLLIAFGAGKFLGEGISRRLVLGSVVAFAGVAVISLGAAAHRDWSGVVLCLTAAVLYAAGMLVQKVALRRVDGLTAIWLGCLVATAVLTPWVPRLAGELRAAPAGALAGVVYLGLFPTAIGFTAWAYALRRMDAGRLGATTYVVPAVSVLLSWLLLAEIPTAYGLAGGAISLIGVAISRKSSTNDRTARGMRSDSAVPASPSSSGSASGSR